MQDLNYDLKQMCHRNRDGSYSKQAARERILTLVANALHGLGFKNLRATSLKPKHVERLVEQWKSEKLSAGTLKNRLAELRWWAEKVAKQNVIARDNDHYGIPHRSYVTNVSQSRELSVGELAKITDAYTPALGPARLEQKPVTAVGPLRSDLDRLLAPQPECRLQLER